MSNEDGLEDVSCPEDIVGDTVPSQDDSRPHQEDHAPSGPDPDGTSRADDLSPWDRPKPFLDHLDEFRSVLLRSIAALALGIAVSIPLAPGIFRLLRAPLSDVTDHPERFLRSIEITGGVSIVMQIVVWSGLLLSAPFLVFFIGRFVFPGLTRRERKAILGGLVLAVGLFVMGVMLCYFVTLPIALRVMFRFHDWLSIQVEWTVTSYVAFSMRLLIAFGLAFELPIVVLILGYLGVVSSAMLRSKRRHAIVVILVIAMVLTPGPDVFSQLIMGIPMILLYESCIWIIWLYERRATGTPT